MAIDFVQNILIPIVSACFIIGITGFFLFYVTKGFRNAWRKSAKFSLKYGLFRKKYPEDTLLWCSDCIEKGIGYYDAKKLMLFQMIPEEKINETLWVYDKLINQLNKENKKNGIKQTNRMEKTKNVENLPKL